MIDQLIVEWPTKKVCVLRLNRPGVYNALSRALTDALREAVAGLTATEARVMILAANGPGFCAGADLKERKGMSDSEKYAHNRAINALANEIAALPIPTVVAIQGTALGGGMEISLACDLRFAAAGIKIGLTEARIGAIPGAGGTQRLPRLIGTARALEMMITGEPITSERAAEWGLVNAAVASAELMDHVMTFATVAASRSRRSGALLKDAVYRGVERPLQDGLEIERAAIAEILASDDYREGLAAFAERRQPVFS
ncbi:enoyl-CoA hydratase/isomerase family protein [Plastorhodobacter daqingensis]|uniref:Enoyl-CoA hydratase/isomerase family protein n=1 Tax=Plastorhodobacter daqingensis TaxID=1387281 RepID=A0ABW2USA1_9RHOB